MLAARAAKIVLKASLVEFTDELTKAFDRFLKDGGNADKGCDAKLAIATTLYETGKGEAETFLKGVRHVQLEPVWGKSVDTAGELRGQCALGLVRVGYRDAAGELADLLADPEPQARIAAARAFAYLDRDEGALPLRTKALLGDDEPDVTGECLTALLRLSPVKYVSFVARFLDDRDPALRDQATNAIGRSKHPAAFEVLRQRWEATIDPTARKALLPVIANVRSEMSLAFLLEQADDASAGAACDVIETMTAYRNDPVVKAKVEAIVKERDNAIVTEAFARTFGREVRRDAMRRAARG
jgi:HEAT repeat protein